MYHSLDKEAGRLASFDIKNIYIFKISVVETIYLCYYMTNKIWLLFN